MSMVKVLWAGGVSGAVLAGVTFGATWFAARQPAGPLARVLDGATHAAGKCQPAEGFAPVVARLESARSTAAGEVDLVTGGLPDDPTADPAPIVIPEGDAPAALPLAFPAESATPPAAPAAGAPMMPYCVDDGNVLPMPRMVPVEEEQEAGCATDLRAMFEALVTGMREPETGALLQGLGAPTPAAPECREDPHHHHHHNGCPYTGGGFHRPSMYTPSPALEKARRLNGRGEERTPAPGVDTMEYRLSDRPVRDGQPGAQ